MTTTTPMRATAAPEDTLYELLFDSAHDMPSELEVYGAYERRIALLEKVITRARDEQAITVAWWWFGGLTYPQIAEAIGRVSASRIQQLVARGRKLAGLPDKRPTA